MIKNNSKSVQNIGIFDSGMGGLNVLSELKRIIPNCNYTYFADTKNIPYGTKSNDEIYIYAKNIIDFFISKDINKIVIACNTVSAIAYQALEKEYKDKVILYPVLQCGVEYAIDVYSKLDNIAVLATRATINSGQYEKMLKFINPNLKVINIDGTGLVEIVEEGTYKEHTTLMFIKNMLKPINTHNIENLILGCTHYSYLLPIFKQFHNINYHNPIHYLTKYVKDNLEPCDNSNSGDIQYFVSSNPDKFIQCAKKFYDIKTADLILF